MSVASARAHEPSMEEILASIRRIIADDQDAGHPVEPLAKVPLEPHPEAGEPEAQVAPALAPEFVASPVEEPGGLMVSGVETDRPDLEITVPEIVFSDPIDGPTPLEALRRSEPAFSAAHDRLERHPEPRDRLISSEATASIGDAFSMLSHTILSNNARTLEDLVREMLKPMLKVWLDDNLPPLVERLVRAEIERVARGR